MNMRCLNDFKNDRVCDMCNLCNNKEYTKCIEEKKSKDEYNKEIVYIKNNCPYRKELWDEYDKFYGCVPNGCGSKFSDSCKPTLECKKHISK